MKAKKLVALCMSAAMVVGAGSIFAACADKDKDNENNNGGGGSSYVYYAVGCDMEGTLGTDMTNGWDPTLTREEATFVQSESNADIYTLELDIYEGSIGTGYSFKFIYKTSADETLDSDTAWARQFGIENIVGYDETTASVKYDGKTLFTTGEGADAHNIGLAANMEGKYKFTLDCSTSKTSPSITVELVDPIVVSHKMYVYGDINEFGWGNGETAYPMAKQISDDGTKWTYQLEITEEDLVRDADGNSLLDEDGELPEDAEPVYAAVHLYNMKDNKWYYDSNYDTVEITSEEIAVSKLYANDATFNLLPKGKYIITFNQEDNSVSILDKTHEVYFRGSEIGWGTTMTADDAKYKLNESKDGNYWYGVVTVPAGETQQVKLYNVLTNEWYGPDDNWNLTEGSYFIRLEVDGNKYACEKIEYAIVGTFLDDDGNTVNFSYAEDVTPMLEVSEDDADVYTATITVTDVTANSAYSWLTNPDWTNGNEGNLFAWKVAATCELCEDIHEDSFNGIIYWNCAPSANNFVTEEGEYTITYNAVTQAITIEKA